MIAALLLLVAVRLKGNPIVVVAPAAVTGTVIPAAPRVTLFTFTVVFETTELAGKETLAIGVALSEGVKVVLPPSVGVIVTLPEVVLGVTATVVADPPPPPPPPPLVGVVQNVLLEGVIVTV